MQPTFNPPKTEEEFKARAAEYTEEQAYRMIDILRNRREALCKPLDIEIGFFEQVIISKKKA